MESVAQRLERTAVARQVGGSIPLTLPFLFFSDDNSKISGDTLIKTF